MTQLTSPDTPQSPDALLEKVLLQGDLSKLSTAQRLTYYKSVCESVGLNPLTKPFDYVKLQGKMTLYARKDATDQLRKIHGVSVTELDIARNDGIISVRVSGRDKHDRTDCELGAVHVGKAEGEALANLEMKAVTKAKRRLTLSMCGLGLLDETEVSTIPGAEVIDAEAPRIEESEIEAAAAEPPPHTEPPPEPAKPAQAPYIRYMAKCQELKSKMQKDRYYEVLKRYDFGHCNEVEKSDTATMTAIVSDLIMEQSK